MMPGGVEWCHLIDTVPDELWTKVRDIVQNTLIVKNGWNKILKGFIPLFFFWFQELEIV